MSSSEVAGPTGPGVAAGLTVLLVDDNQDSTRALGMLLEHFGHAVVTAHDGAEALLRAAEARPDVGLLDLGLPVLDGYQVAQALRARPGGERLLLVAISGYGQPNDRARSKAAGFDHHMVKPVDCGALLALLQQRARPAESGEALPV
jgi:two-component system CheB/CheR fusion protein